MGLPINMDNLHAPTVPSGPSTTATTNGQVGHLSFAELQQKKSNIEAELQALGGVLDTVILPEWLFGYGADGISSMALT